MKAITWMLVFCCTYFIGLAQEDIEKRKAAIIEEARLLVSYTNAKNSVESIFEKQYKGKEKAVLFITYKEDNGIKTVFCSGGAKPKAICTIILEENMDAKTAKVDVEPKALLSDEMDLYQMKKAALQLLSSDALFDASVKSTTQIYPLIKDGLKKVYILPEQTRAQEVVFGNDYLITFHSDNTVNTKVKIHPSSVSVKFREEGVNTNEPMREQHSHFPETGDLFTVTDVCNLMLYQSKANWKQHTIISQNYISIWNCDANQMITIPKGGGEDKK